MKKGIRESNDVFASAAVVMYAVALGAAVAMLAMILVLGNSFVALF